MFIIRTAFWLSLVILCLPVGADDSNASAEIVGAAEAVSVAKSTVGDLSKFCERNPETCSTGGQVISSFGQKARYGAKIVYNYLDDKFGVEQSNNAGAEVKAELTNDKNSS